MDYVDAVKKCVVLVCMPLALLGCGDDGGGAAATEGTAGTVGGTANVPTSGPTGGSPTGPTDGAPTGSADDNDTNNPNPTGNGPAGSCCEEHPTPSCNPFLVASCVCETRPLCCEFEWDAGCVDVATNMCDGCGPVVDSGNSTGMVVGDGDCCQANGTPGCNDGGIQACVCAENSACCDNGWDGTCVGIADGMCGAGCSMGTDTGNMMMTGTGTGSGGTGTTGGSGTAGSGSGSGTAG
ncbi:MAG: hypothetical protein AAF721_03030 [Myxococcota bacterium]